MIPLPPLYNLRRPLPCKRDPSHSRGRTPKMQNTPGMHPWPLPPLALSALALEGWLFLARYVLVALLLLATAALWKGAAACEGGESGLPAWRRRSRERTLLLVALVVVAACMHVITLAMSAAGTVPAWTRLAWFAGIFAVAHGILVAVDHQGDPLLLPTVALLAGLSNVEILRLQPLLATRQMAWTGVGLAGMLGWMLVVRDYRRLADYKYLMLGTAGLLQLSAMVLGTEINGACLWIKVGSMEIQPVEFVKILLITFLAAYLSQNRLFLSLRLSGDERRLWLRALVPLLVAATAAEAVFVVQKDLGQGLLFFGVFLAMFHIATRRLDLVLSTCGLFMGMSFACYHLFGHVRVRFAAWIDPWRSPADWGFQIVQSLYALASGGWWGSGLGRGQPWRIPAAVTDFIYPSLVEEMGVITGIAILGCFWILVARAFQAARRARDRFGWLLATGIAAVLGWQTFVIVAGTIKMIPMTGITLPFMSYGGSSLLSNFVLLGILLQISHRASQPPAPGSVADVTPPTRAPGSLDTRSRLEAGFALLLLAPGLMLVAFTMGDGPILARSPDNPRTREDLRARGEIVDRHAESLARSTWRDNHRAAPWNADAEVSRRRYAPGAAFGNLVGYDSLLLGRAGVERSYERLLHGTYEPDGLLAALALVRGGDLRGTDVVLTVDAALQRKACELLVGRRGAIVALEPATGEILALASSPGFDANLVEKQWAGMSRERTAPLLNRALEGTYPPGSVIKPLVVAAALERGAVEPRETFPCPGYIDIKNYRFHDAVSGGHGSVDVSGALTWSCNVALAHMGLKLGAEGLVEGLRRFGMGEIPQVGLPAAGGNVPAAEELTDGTVAQVAFGQGPLLVSPLQVALATSAIANGGRIMVPRLVRATRSAGGREQLTEPQVWRQAVTPQAARAVGAMMETVVERGTGTAARVSGVRVAGKTGTAENPHGAPHAWFAAYAPAEAPRVVVVILVENGGSGGHDAAPLAPPLIEQALSGKPH